MRLTAVSRHQHTLKHSFCSRSCRKSEQSRFAPHSSFTPPAYVGAFIFIEKLQGNGAEPFCASPQFHVVDIRWSIHFPSRACRNIEQSRFAFHTSLEGGVGRLVLMIEIILSAHAPGSLTIAQLHTRNRSVAFLVHLIHLL